MRCSGFGAVNGWPADRAACPIALALSKIVDKLSMLDRSSALPLAAVVPVGRNTRIGTNPCAGDSQKFRVLFHEVVEGLLPMFNHCIECIRKAR